MKIFLTIDILFFMISKLCFQWDWGF